MRLDDAVALWSALAHRPRGASPPESVRWAGPGLLWLQLYSHSSAAGRHFDEFCVALPRNEAGALELRVPPPEQTTL